MGMRRPNFIRNDDYLQECIAHVRLAEDFLETDQVLCSLVQLQTLADSLSSQISPDYYVPIPETTAWSAYQEFEKDIEAWQESNAHSMQTCKFLVSDLPVTFTTIVLNLIQSGLIVSVSFSFHVIGLYMHELVMQHVSTLEPGVPLSRSQGKGQSQVPSDDRTSSISIGLTSTLGILDTFLRLSPLEIRSLPTLCYAQVAHACVSLIKM